MASQTCAYCYEKINPRAVVCPFCGRDLPSAPPAAPASCRFPLWIPLVGLTAATLTGAALLAAEFLRERRHWLD
ncbi:hypothetical protein [Desulfurivibrio alkaliphilus]|uniref:Zinc ribbon domain-containing protein n=1 Tax=Desulfurivibrio alkaliphilus (strain DSM 19089 / UNIQEM U267 / AHT2) TaxID=589865 RepID=D6Z455_DESAT|nr:hypothetical protein [Desulfurivibrio alkaliphilus]ADH86330.1 hypothetical protein DaAHT2_1637 [Desulfurivibrio alkaliphilus AHT 2]